jgi:hypothetical protein
MVHGSAAVPRVQGRSRRRGWIVLQGSDAVVIRYNCKLVRLHWKFLIQIVLLIIGSTVVGSWAYERTLAPDFRIIHETCPLGLSADELRGIRGMMPIPPWKS